MIEKVRTATNKDEKLCTLKDIVHKGWTNSINQVPKEIKPYWSYRDEITIEDGTAMKGQRILIPLSFQGEVLEQLHAANQAPCQSMGLLAKDK